MMFEQLEKYLIDNDAVSAEFKEKYNDEAYENISEIISWIFKAYNIKEGFKWYFAESLEIWLTDLTTKYGESMMKKVLEEESLLVDKKDGYNDVAIIRTLEDTVKEFIKDNELRLLLKKVLLSENENIQKIYIDTLSNIQIPDLRDKVYEVINPVTEQIKNNKLEAARHIMQEVTENIKEKIDDDSEIYDAIDKLFEEKLNEEIVSWILKIPEEFWTENIIRKLGCSYNNSSRFDESIEMLKKYKEEYKDKDGYLHYLYGYAWEGKKLYTEAAQNYEESIKRDPDYLPPKDALKRCNKILGKVNKPKEVKIKITYDHDNKRFKVEEGCINLRYMGIYEKENIEIDFDWDEYKEYYFEDVQDDDFKKLLKVDMDYDEAAKGLTKYYNKRFAGIKKNIKMINDNFLVNIFMELNDCEYNFWEEEDGIPNYIIKSRMPKTKDEKEIISLIYTKDESDAINDLYSQYDNPDNRDNPKGDVAEFIHKYFPMINLKKFISNIEGEYLNLNGEEISFQCDSDMCDNGIVCGAYAVIKPDCSLYGWDNC